MQSPALFNTTILIREQVSDVRIVVAVDPGDSAEDVDLPDRCRVVKLANSVTYDRYEERIQTQFVHTLIK